MSENCTPIFMQHTLCVMISYNWGEWQILTMMDKTWGEQQHNWVFTENFLFVKEQTFEKEKDGQTSMNHGWCWNGFVKDKVRVQGFNPGKTDLR